MTADDGADLRVMVAPDKVAKAARLIHDATCYEAPECGHRAPFTSLERLVLRVVEVTR